MTSLSPTSPARPALTADAFRRRRLGKYLHRKAIRHFCVLAAGALLVSVMVRGPVGLAAWGLLFAFGVWRLLVDQRRINFLSEARITLGEAFVSEFRIKPSAYRIVMSYTFEGRRYSCQKKLDQADHADVLSREVDLYALFDRRNPAKMLGYHAGTAIPRWLKGRAERVGASERSAQRLPLGPLGSEEQEEVEADR